jgi:hypothetical protein
MTKEEITAGNKLIAGFMGYKYYPYESPEDPSQRPPKYKSPFSWGWIKGDPEIAGQQQKLPKKDHHWLCRSHRDLRYYNEWHLLMPVVEKIESLWTEVDGHFGVYIYSNGCTIQGAKFRSDTEPHSYFLQMDGITKIKATWNAVVAFIQWYNQQHPTASVDRSGILLRNEEDTSVERARTPKNLENLHQERERGYPM